MPIVLASAVLDLIGFGIILPLLPFYALTYGASPLVVTLLSVIFSAAQFAAAPAAGRLSDRIGRKPVFLAGLALTVVGYLWLAYAGHLWELFAARAIAGAAAGKMAVAQAIIADITTADRRARGMGLLGAAFGIGMILGPSIGGLLSGEPAAPDHRLPALAAAAGSAIALGFALLLLKESHPPERRIKPAGAAGPGWRENWRTIRAERPFLLLVLLNFAVFFVFSQIETLFPLWAAAVLGWGPRDVGLSFAFIGVVIIVIQGAAIGPLVRRLGEHRTLGLGLLILSGGCLLSIWVATATLLLVTVGLIAAGFGLVNPNLTSIASKLADPANLGAVMGIAAAAGTLGRVLGPGAGGWIFEAVSHNAPYTIGGAILLVALALLWPGVRTRRVRPG